MLKKIVLFVIFTLLSACDYDSVVEITKDNKLIHTTHFTGDSPEKTKEEFTDGSCYPAIKESYKMKVFVDSDEKFKVGMDLSNLPNIKECEDFLVTNNKGLIALGRSELSTDEMLGEGYHSNYGNIERVRNSSNSVNIYLVSKYNIVTKLELRNEFKRLEEDIGYIIIDSANSKMSTIKKYVNQFPKK